MNLLQMNLANKQYGSKILFKDAQFSINAGEHVGVIGPNGAGKTTLFKIMVGLEELDSGEIIKASQIRIGYLEQESDWSVQQIVENYLIDSCLTPIWELKQLGLRIGLTESHFQSKMSDLSGGYRMRVKLIYLIGQQPDLMLLDEPTNFLDLESIMALEEFLQEYHGAFLLISHDREFLRRTTEHTLEVESEDIIKFPGHIDDYFEQKEELAKLQLQKAANLEVKRQHLQDFVDRFRAKATKAKQAQSRMKQLEKLERIEIKPLPVRSRIHLPEPEPTGKEVLAIENANLGYGDKVILSSVNLIINRGDRIGVVGYNGAGKSTLLKSLADRIPLLSGAKKYGHKVEYSYFAQHLAEDLEPEDNVLEALQRKASLHTTSQEVLNIAGSLLFSGENLKKKIKVLSGGEKTRVALGQILLQKKPLLFLDEPTNHLDFDTVVSLSEALAHFKGTLILVSHDRSFIKNVVSKIFEIRDGKAIVYPGNYDDYLWSLEKGTLSQLKTVSTPELDKEYKERTESGNDNRKFNYKEETKKIASEIKELQRKILKTEEIIFNMNQKQLELTTLLISTSGPKANEISKESANITEQINQSEEALLTHMENLEIKQKELESLKT